MIGCKFGISLDLDCWREGVVGVGGVGGWMSLLDDEFGVEMSHEMIRMMGCWVWEW